MPPAASSAAPPSAAYTSQRLRITGLSSTEDRGSQLIEPLRFLRDRRLEDEICQRRPTPECECLGEPGGALLRGQRLGLADPTLEPVQVYLLWLNAEDVAPGARRQAIGPQD